MIYESEADFDGILQELREAENVEQIEFISGDQNGSTDGFEEQDIAKFYVIIQEILRKPNLKKITYEFSDFRFDGDGAAMNFDEFTPNLSVKKLELPSVWDLTSWNWKKILDSTPNVEEIDVVSWEDFIELPQILRNFKVFKELKILNVVMIYGNEIMTGPDLTFQEKRAVAQEAMEVLQKELPIQVKASVKEVMDHQAFMDNHGQPWTTNLRSLIEKEANEEPRLSM